jgi:nitroreductase family protein
MIVTESDVVTMGLHAAIRAPSPYNTQPWLFDIDDADGVDLLLDVDRILPVADPDGRQARLACGAALLNFRLAVAAAGRTCVVDLLPDPSRPALLARIGIGARSNATAEQIRLAAAIPRRFSNRRPFVERPVTAQARHALVGAARPDGADLVLVDEVGLLGSIASLIRRADTVQTEDPAFCEESALWIAGHGDDDGVPAFAGGPRSAGGLLPVRHHGPDSQVERPYEQDPVVVVLTTPTDEPLSQVRAGLALQRVLLTATDLGLSASFLSQPMEIAGTRAELRTMLGGDWYPQCLLRLGHGYPGTPTGRRPLSAVMCHTIR